MDGDEVYGVKSDAVEEYVENAGDGGDKYATGHGGLDTVDGGSDFGADIGVADNEVGFGLARCEGWSWEGFREGERVKMGTMKTDLPWQEWREERRREWN